MKILTFGELMLRLKTPEHLKILQADTFEASYGGAEANVAVSLATLGNDVSYVTKVPEHQVGQAAINEIRRFGVDTTRVLRGGGRAHARHPAGDVGGGRVGIYYFEKGTNIRPTSVVYDRAYSAIAMAEAEEFDWEKLLEGVDLFYFSGITPAISCEIEKTLESALMLCKEKKIQVVCDLNYRGKMWSAKDAQRVMRRLMSYVDVCIANDEDFESSLGIPAYDGDMSRGIEQIESYKEGMLEIQKQFPNCKAVASVLRNLYTVEDGDWMGIYLKDGKFYESPVHKVHSFEAVGAGDAFGAGLIHAMAHDFAPQRTIDFAISASVLKLMIQHDANVVSEKEIEQIMKQGGTNLQR